MYKGKCYSLILSCDIRWDTYFGEFETLLLIAAALKDWTRDPRITEEARESQKLRTVIGFIQNPRSGYILLSSQILSHQSTSTRSWRR
jgi:hypothetical protein